MAFRKRNVGISQSGAPSLGENAPPPITPNTDHISVSSSPGLRPSPADGRLTTSTGTTSVDNLLAGHAGLVLGNSLLIEENGTTDYTGALLRSYAAEGLVQGHKVHVVGAGERWARDLPGVVGPAGGGDHGSKGGREVENEKMKIAWRYERQASGQMNAVNRAAVDRRPASQPRTTAMNGTALEPTVFCHTFDIAKRLELPHDNPMNFLKLRAGPSEKPFGTILQDISQQISVSKSNIIHRLVVPNLLSPATYPQHASEPTHLLQFLHGVRALLRQYPNRLTAMMTFPLELIPRSAGVVRSIEHMVDGVLEFTPFPYSMDEASSLNTSGAATSQEDKPQGIVKIHKLPIFHERGGGGGSGMKSILGNDLAFTVSRRNFIIKPFSLPPADGDNEAQHPASASKETGFEPSTKLKKLTKGDIDF